MADTQWPRYYVFEQRTEDAPFVHVGSVHASDGEMALLAARDIFARRPERTNMWVVLDRVIYAKTREELPVFAEEAVSSPEPGSEQLYQVFGKRSHKGASTLLGSVQAVDRAQALLAALKTFGEDHALVWWVIPDTEVVRSGMEEKPALYESSPGKDYRHENHYPVRTMMMQLRNRKKPGKD